MKTKFKFVSRNASMGAVIAAFGLFSLLGMASNAVAGSLWREAVTDERGMYADKKARRIGDIVTVSIVETLVYDNARGLKTARTTTGSAPGIGGQIVNSLINSVSSKNSATAPGDVVRRKFPSNLLPKSTDVANTLKILDPASVSTLEGSGEITNSQTLNFTMAVQVIDVLPNGNLVIEGIRQIGFSNERQFISLRGIIRPVDIRGAVGITPKVRSEDVADARIEVVAEGALTDTAKKGWLKKLDDKITPY
jgi:flagellar L-ring protein precursor FlgH